MRPHRGEGSQILFPQVVDSLVEQVEDILVDGLLTVELRLVNGTGLQGFAPGNIAHEVGEGSQVQRREHLSHTQQMVRARLGTAGCAAFADNPEGEQVAVGGIPGVVEGSGRVDLGETHLGVVHLVEDARLLFHVNSRIEGEVARNDTDGRSRFGIGEEVAGRHLFGVVFVAVEAVHHVVGTGGEQAGGAEDIDELFHIHVVFEG